MTDRLFMPLAAYLEMVPDEIDWIWHGLLAPGLATMTYGKPKAGKSTVLSAAFGAIATGADEFLGLAVRQVPVWIASEEGGSTLKPKLPGTGDVHVLSRDMHKTRPPWAVVLGGVQHEAPAPGLLVIDTYRKWASREGSETDPSVIREIIGCLDPLLADGWAVVIVHHSRKAEGEHGEALSGNNDLAGAVDVLAEVKRVSGAKNQRIMVAESRREETPAALIYERRADVDLERPHTFELIARGEDEDDAIEQSIATRARAFIYAEPGRTQKDVLAALRVNEEHGRAALKRLAREGAIEIVEGPGKSHLHYPAGAGAEGVLPARERVFEALNGGATVADLAEALDMSEDAVRKHLRALAEDGRANKHPRPESGPLWAAVQETP